MFAKIIPRIETYLPTKARENTPKSLILHSTRNHPRFEDVLFRHKEKGWDGVGYHLFVDFEGKVFQARPFDKEGAHAIGYNTSSIGICVYSKDGSLDSNKVKVVRNLIQCINEQFLGLELLSHTEAQVRYNNLLLEKYGFAERFIDSVDVVNQTNFEKLKKEMDILSGKLSTEKYSQLKEGLKSFKNCPGEMYFNFI